MASHSVWLGEDFSSFHPPLICFLLLRSHVIKVENQKNKTKQNTQTKQQQQKCIQGWPQSLILLPKSTSPKHRQLFCHRKQWCPTISSKEFKTYYIFSVLWVAHMLWCAYGHWRVICGSRLSLLTMCSLGISFLQGGQEAPLPLSYLAGLRSGPPACCSLRTPSIPQKLLWALLQGRLTSRVSSYDFVLSSETSHMTQLHLLVGSSVCSHEQLWLLLCAHSWLTKTGFLLICFYSLLSAQRLCLMLNHCANLLIYSFTIILIYPSLSYLPLTSQAHLLLAKFLFVTHCL